MKTLKLTLIALMLNATYCTNSFAKQIDFHINGIKDGSGKLYIQLFKGQENYEKGKPEAATVVAVESDSTTVSFQDLTVGNYALRFFHDENDNGKLETNLFGLPTEGYGFSNDAKPDFGPVSYEEIQFSLDPSDEIVVNSTSVIY